MFIFIIWLCGYFTVYFIERYLIKQKYKRWRRKDKYQTLLVSLLSWIGILLLFVGATVERIAKEFENEAPAKW